MSLQRPDSAAVTPRTRRDTVQALLDAVIREELAIASLIEAEAQKVRAFTGAQGQFPYAPTTKQINEFQGNLARILDALNDTQKNLLRLLEVGVELMEVRDDDPFP